MSTLQRLLITGGHPTPALALIDYIKKNIPQCAIAFVGRRHINRRETADSYEYQEVISRGVPFSQMVFERGIRGFIELPFRVLQSVQLVRKMKPQAVLSFGGYMGVPICFAANILRIPVFLHEQTIRPGIANIMLSKLAQSIMVSFPQTKTYFQAEKVVYTGNPLRENLFKKSNPHTFAHVHGPSIFVMGGNTGSHSINMHILQILPQLIEFYTIIHQIGNVAEYRDWECALKAKETLSTNMRDRYIPLKHLSTAEVTAAYQKSDIVVCRSGANTILELIALRKPAVLIPLPWAAHDEQRLHARILRDARVAELCEQSENSQVVFESIQKVFNHVQSYISNYDSLAHYYVPEAAQRIYGSITQSLTSQTNTASP